jgi:hypothetical protein
MWRAFLRLGLALLAVSVAACAGLNRVPGEPTAASLSEKKKGIALIRYAIIDPGCLEQYLYIGAPEGTGHRVVKKLQDHVKYGTNPATIARIAEIELEPGTYHVIGMGCHRARRSLGWGSTLGGTYSDSLAHFDVRAGEVVNVGFLTLLPLAHQVRVRITVQDMPLQELRRFAAERPTVYAAMVTRLASPAKDWDRECADARAMHAQGKLAKLPAPCS